MLKYNDIRDAFALKLSEKYPGINIYDEKIQQGFESPAFFVQLIPGISTRESKNVKSRFLLVDIQYFPKEVNSTEEVLNMTDDLEDMFKSHIAIKDRNIKLDNAEPQTVNDGIGTVLHFQIPINYYELIEKDTGKVDVMQDIIL
ncbi:hypothetical protein G8S49_01495 [Clostridium botulinum C]|uniref:Uncharacterized protein n=2 Tax=Clostridium botulinum TaxID=1491 RepID=A0A9Q4Y1A5_CLOBO|nr:MULTISPECIES: hypothetical protein [Clostridium]MCD3194249.1 hypothetical protein [Clostridium botulinum C]MCD3199122.1 hypothetical protein [Clostridium botulinum C]MCD3204597.1 hypothetical protein [Clostridium botulinum C]MCD3207940.1 hypothetical protein [Clostridium botulinum C]MCD3225120.1 hypothetical protein [Clostridium botulinum C]